MLQKGTKRQIILRKGAEKFIFRYDAGSEDKLLDAFIEQAKNKRTNFDWFDAAVLSFKLTRSLISNADELLHDDAERPTNCERIRLGDPDMTIEAN